MGLIAAAALGRVCSADQNYFIPEVSLTAEEHTNLDLTNGADSSNSSLYRATLGAILGSASQRAKTEFRPRVNYQSFSGIDIPNRFEEFADLTGEYDFLRGNAGVVAHFSRQDVINSEAGRASFDPNDPNNPGNAESGVVQVRGTRTRYDLEPSFEHRWSERAFLAGRFQYESVRYDANLAGLRVGYDSPYAELTFGRIWLRSRLGIGPYVTRYEANDDSNRTDTAGAVVELAHDWSPLSNVNVTLRVEHNECQVCTVDSGGSATAWGLEVAGYRRNTTGGLRYGIGRFLVPSSLGERREEDQLRLQYSRAFSVRTTFNGALRYSRDSVIGNAASGENRDRAFADLSISREMTRTLLVNVGYRFVWQDLKTVEQRAHDQTVFLGLTYRGMQPQGVKETR